MESIDILRRLTDALEWAMPYAEKEHERQYPKETYVADNNVALSVSKARSALILGQEYLGWVEGRRKYSDIN